MTARTHGSAKGVDYTVYTAVLEERRVGTRVKTACWKRARELVTAALVAMVLPTDIPR